MLINNEGYFAVLEQIKERIKIAQHNAVLSINHEQIVLYWNIGNIIIKNTQYGNKFVENLAKDIKLEFPKTKGYSVRNLKYMRKFAAFVSDFQIVQTLSAQFSWSHNILLMKIIISTYYSIIHDFTVMWLLNLKPENLSRNTQEN
ncbi:MAG: DUF1016 N-terminal domain-containing protein [Azoarcus sp.]|jgi:predicted nuclease of restriction endonuclease-like (RecB) superfamily|nr:DUF1016 N-terminal domain-containing protein [Azoarcus sp.]